MNQKIISDRSPIARRASPQRAISNSALILKAIEHEATEVGLDQISVRAVAKRAGLTSGAIYARYENVNEMIVALWIEHVSSQFESTLRRSIRAIVNRDAPAFDQEVTDLLQSPTSIMKLGAEFLVVAQRNDAVGEVVIPEVSRWLIEAGLNEESSRIDRAAVAIAASIVIGAALRSFITTSNPNLGYVAQGIRRAFLAASPQNRTQSQHTPSATRSATGNHLRDTLIDATAEVMSKAGFNGATVSRIARKSGITSGSLYHYYEDKEALINDAVYELMRATQNENLEAKRAAAHSHQKNFGLTDSFNFGLIPDRFTWLRFRQECIIASRHHKTTRLTLKKVLKEIEVQMHEAFSQLDPQVVSLVNVGEQAIGYGYCSLLGYTALFQSCDFDAIMVQVAQQNGL